MELAPEESSLGCAHFSVCVEGTRPTVVTGRCDQQRIKREAESSGDTHLLRAWQDLELGCVNVCMQVYCGISVHVHNPSAASQHPPNAPKYRISLPIKPSIPLASQRGFVAPHRAITFGVREGVRR